MGVKVLSQVAINSFGVQIDFSIFSRYLKEWENVKVMNK